MRHAMRALSAAHEFVTNEGILHDCSRAKYAAATLTDRPWDNNRPTADSRNSQV
jgi:hypothetical protein